MSQLETKAQDAHFCKNHNMIYLDQDGCPKTCLTCNKWIFDLEKHYKKNLDDDTFPTISPVCQHDDGGNVVICTRCGNLEVPGSDHNDGPIGCNPSCFASGGKAVMAEHQGGGSASGGEAVMAEHQGGGSASGNEEKISLMIKYNLSHSINECFSKHGWSSCGRYAHCELCHERIFDKSVPIDEEKDKKSRVYNPFDLFSYFSHKDYLRGCCKLHCEIIYAHYAQAKFNGPYKHPEYNRSIEKCGCGNVFSTVADNADEFCSECTSRR